MQLNSFSMPEYQEEVKLKNLRDSQSFADKDRLARFGFEIIKHVVEFNGGSIVVLSDENDSPERELVEDLISITTVFSARIHGLRKYTDEIKKNQANIE